ncbi:GntR family transcriptional regulator [Desulfosarcina sp.]|uniref:GntR family transcriptional regulator n=1 Tax=Desulfosarcina sp. TaxID=2027861 RepID=UPI0039B9BBB7
MAETLGIGRTPIRESLFRLAAEGLLQVKAGRGFFCVTSPSATSRTCSKRSWY